MCRKPFSALAARLFWKTDSTIVMVGGQPNSGLVAFDPATGKTVWESVGQKNWEGVPMTGWPGEQNGALADLGKSRPAIRPRLRRPFTGGGKVLCLTRQGLVSGGSQKRAASTSPSGFRLRVNRILVNAMCPVVVDDLIFISAAYYKIGPGPVTAQARTARAWRKSGEATHWNCTDHAHLLWTVIFTRSAAATSRMRGCAAWNGARAN